MPSYMVAEVSQPLTENGDVNGFFSVAEPFSFSVGATVLLTSTAVEATSFVVSRVTSAHVYLTLPSGARPDLSAYHVADGAQAIQALQSVSSQLLPVDLGRQSAAIEVNLGAQLAPIDVNLESQTGNVNVNVAAQDAPIDVNLAGQDADVNVNLANQAGNIDVNLAAQTSDVNVHLTGQTSAVEVAGRDGVNALHTISTDTSGNVNVVGSIEVHGANSPGASITKAPVLVSGQDSNSKVRILRTDNQGYPQMSYEMSLRDSFGRLRTSSPETIFDSKQISDNQALFWDDAVISGSGTTSTYNTNQSSTTLAVSNATAGKRVRQTFRQFNYQPGKSQLIYMTFVMSSAPVAGIVRRLGQFNESNGIFFEQNGTALNLVRRTFTSGSAVDNTVAQASWNLDTLDGNGPSGITLDVTKTNILAFDYQWLGVGVIRVGFIIGGVLIYCHQFQNANVLTVVWASNPNLPLRFSIENLGAGPAASLIHICTTVITEGGRDVDRIGANFYISRGATALTTGNDTSLYPILAMRLRSGYQHAQVIPASITVLSTTNSDLEWMLILNPTVTGTAFSYSTVTNSAVEADVTRTSTTTVSGGTVLAGGYIAANGSFTEQLSNDLTIGVSIAGVSDVLVLAARRITGTSEALFASLTWHETQ